MSLRLFFTVAMAGLSAACFATTGPVLDNPIPTNGQVSQVDPRVPVGKTLIFPITATDADGDMLRYTVTSSNPVILVRAHTGQPHVKFNISHADGGTGDPAFSGTIEIAMLHDMTPITCGFIEGFAAGHYYDGQIFHRIADLDPSATGGSFIFQGGDPDGDGGGGPGFNFDNEFQSQLIFAGRGQLAMANEGFSVSPFVPTNGSQFFITNSSPRFLDFRHTIFGQVVRGWDLLPKLAAVPRFPAPTPPATTPQQDKPMVDVKLDSATVAPNFTDAILEISATAPGTGTITVTVNDGTSPAVSTTFTVTAYKDKINDPAFLAPKDVQFSALGAITAIPLKAVDLESDYLLYGESVRSGVGATNPNYNPALIRGDGFGRLGLGVTVTPYDMTVRGLVEGLPGPSDEITVPVAIGDASIDVKAVSLDATPGVGLISQLVATYTDDDPRGVTADFTATVNWGDGTPLAGGIIGRDQTRPGIANYNVASSHTYQHAGTYPLTVELTGNKGGKGTARGTVVVTDAPLAAVGQALNVISATPTNRVIATFTDAAPGKAGDYSAQISWGDGRNSAGTIRRTPDGLFQVLGTHTFLDAENFLIGVRVRKTADGPSSDSIAWSYAKTSGFAGLKHRPPFAVPHLVGAFGNGITRLPGSVNEIATYAPPVRTITGTGANLQALASCQLLVINAGTKASPEGTIQFYLSADDKLNLADQTLPDPANPGQFYTNPKDKLVTIGTLATGKLQSFAPGQVALYNFTNNSTGDERLVFPKGENGSSFNLLAHLTYSDPIGDNLPIGHDVVFGPINGFHISTTSLLVQEASATVGSKTFTVTMDRQPTANVTVALTVSDTTQVDVTPTTLTFTPQDYNTAAAHTVTVTAKDDATVDGTKSVTITLNRAVSLDRQWNGIPPGGVFVTVLDKATTTP